MGSSRSRHVYQRRALSFENLEQRQLLAGQLGSLAASAWASGEASDYPRFASAAELKQYLIKDALTRYADQFGKDGWYWPGPWLYDSKSGGADALPMGIAAGGAGGSYSGTNNQVAGVAEGDIVQTDGRYLYELADQHLTIIDVAAPGNMSVASTTDIVGCPQAMYLDGSRLTVISADNGVMWLDAMPMAKVAWAPGSVYEPSFHVTVWDVTDPQKPSLAGDQKLDGTYIDSRDIAGFVYLVSQHNFLLPPPELLPVANTGEKTDTTKTAGAVSGGTAAGNSLMPIWIDPTGPRYVYETQDQYLARIDSQVLDLALPHFSAYGPDGALQRTSLLTQPDRIYQPLAAGASNLLSVTTIAATAPAPGIVASTSAPLDWASEVYVSPENLYLATPQWNTTYPSGSGTAIYKFALNSTNGQVALVASGSVPGSLLNQFSMDESQGYLRLVTQSGWRTTAVSQLFVLQQTGQTLEVVGSLEDLAPGEQLYSVRFRGDLGYFVTFGPTGGNWYDPLFTVDLSDPLNPLLGGRLEMPGYSNYLQAIDGEHLFGLGRNADPSNGRQLEPQVSLYDVTDLQNPELAGRLSFADQGSAWSEAFDDHHAIGYYPEYHILAIPMNTFGLLPASVDSGGNGLGATDGAPQYGTLSALWVFQIEVSADGQTPDTIRLLGQISHDSLVRRSVRIGDVLYSISQTTIKANPIANPELLLGELQLSSSTDPGGSGGSSGSGGTDPTTGSTLPDGAAPLVELAKLDLAKRLGVAVDTISLVSAEAVSWSDSSLGLPEPGRFYAQVITPGFQITLKQGDQRHVYHTDSTQTVLLANSTPAAPEVSIRVETVDASGQAISEIEACQEFTVNVYVQDLRSSPQGISAAYLDLLYRADLASLTGPLKFGSDYQTSPSGDTNTAGLIDELGAVGAAQTADGAEHLLAQIHFKSLATGTLSFLVQPATDSGHGILLNGETSALRVGQVDYVGTVLNITEGWQNSSNPGDVNGDGQTTALDVLALVTQLNIGGNHELGRLGSYLQLNPGSGHDFLDVNGDGKLTPLDALRLITHLNRTFSGGESVGTEASADWGWPFSLVGPLGGFVDWKALTSALDKSLTPATLAAVSLTADEALDLARRTLQQVDVASLALAAGSGSSADPRAVVNQLGQTLVNLGRIPATDQLQGLVNAWDGWVDKVDLEVLLPSLAKRVDLTQARATVREALFAQLTDPLFVADLLE